MAYGRKRTGKRVSGKRKPARKVSYKRRVAPKRRVARKRAAPKTQTIRIVMVSQPASPTLATPAAKAAPVRARF